MNHDPFYREPSYEREARLREKRDEKVADLRKIVAKLNEAYALAKDNYLLNDVLPENGNEVGELLAMNIDELNAYIEQLKRG